jgi:holo-[acyl-carrier protein] synthase
VQCVGQHLKEAVHSVGIDIIELERVEKALARFGERFLLRVYTEREIRFCRGRIPELAARFAAKEAISKALGTGMRGVAWREMEVLPDRRGKPLVTLHGRALERAGQINLVDFAISLSHSNGHAIAFVVASDHPEHGD